MFSKQKGPCDDIEKTPRELVGWKPDCRAGLPGRTRAVSETDQDWIRLNSFPDLRCALVQEVSDGSNSTKKSKGMLGVDVAQSDVWR